jgi:pyruvate-formate lyase
MNSVTGLPLSRLPAGINLTVRIPGKQTDPGNLAALIRSYFAGGGMQVQFNPTDSRTLRAAQSDPEKYRDLLVRISGYSVLFTGLTDTTQDEIISRTEYGCG